MNVFMVRKGALITPPITDNILEGITRRSIMEVAQQEFGLTVEERSIDRTEAFIADEMFFTGTAAELTPIRSVDQVPVGEGKPGEITRKIQSEFLGIAKGRLADRFGWLTPVPAAALSR